MGRERSGHGRFTGVLMTMMAVATEYAMTRLTPLRRRGPGAGPVCGPLVMALMAAMLLGPDGAPAQATVPTPPLRLHPGDVVRLVVENDSALNGEYPVGTDGAVVLPLIGPVRATDRDFSEAEAEIRSELGRELATGMTLQVTPVFRVAVVGEVRMPGLHPLDPTRRMVDALAMAGGFTPLADRESIALVRDGRTVLEADEALLVDGGPPLRSGDRIVVGRVGWFRENLGVVIGAVGSLTVAIVTGLIVR